MDARRVDEQCMPVCEVWVKVQTRPLRRSLANLQSHQASFGNDRY
jgi:hypothetical protein